MKNVILKIIFAAWIILWAIFAVRELFIKTNMNDYKVLVARSVEGKRSYVTGDELYSFIEFCKKNTPERASYAIVGFDDGAIEKRRAAYYLYPRVEARDGDFLFVYKSPGFAREGYGIFMKLDDMRYILKKDNRKAI